MKDFTPDLANIIRNDKKHDINGMLTISTKIEEFKNISNIAKSNKNRATGMSSNCKLLVIVR